VRRLHTVAATIAFFIYFTSELKRLDKKTNDFYLHSIKELQEQVQVGSPFASKDLLLLLIMSCSNRILHLV
jgi:hypothetical protein